LNDSSSGAATADSLRQHLLEIARERDSAYRALQEREAELARIQRIGRVGGLEVDLRGGFRNRRSPEYLLIHGLPPEAVNESHEDWVNRVHPDDREAAEKQFLDAIAGKDEDYTAEYRIIRPRDSELRWIRVIAKIDRDPNGRAIRLLGAHIDITDRMLAQETLRESEQRFRLIANSAPVPIWVTKLDRTRSFANKAYVDFLGLPYDEAVKYDWRKALHPDDLSCILKEQIEGESSLKPFVLEARYRRADGEWRWLRSESQPRWDPTGKHIGFIGVANDITAAKHAEIGLRRLNETLEERIRERTA
jgi:PAS domain S-box-containing protein